MKLSLIIVLCLIPFTIAQADVNNLSGGVLIAHHPPEECFSYDMGANYCWFYDNLCPLTDAANQDNRTDRASSVIITDYWYVIAAFTEDKIWCGVQFGLGDYDPLSWYMTSEGGNCLVNSLEIPTAGWPGPNTGIAIAATDEPFEGNFLAVFWFEGYHYADDPTVIDITGYPGHDFIGFANCEAPSVAWPAEGGAMGVFTDGVAVYPQEPIPVACCLWEGSCIVTETIEECLDMGGCFGIEEPYGCDPNPCPQSIPAICCLEDGSCLEICSWQCDEIGGTTYLDIGSCNNDPCEFSATGEASWGEIKTRFK
jgi:hypothetical protein